VLLGVQQIRERLTVAAARSLLAALENVVANVAAHPDDLQLRTIRLSNPKFRANIGDVPGGLLVLRGCGFEGRGLEDIPLEVRKPMANVRSGERFLVGIVPPTSDHGGFALWQVETEGKAAFLGALEQELRTRSAHMTHEAVGHVLAADVVGDEDVRAIWRRTAGA
jgi:hypothetical protein